jgi:hypothetical protein
VEGIGSLDRVCELGRQSQRSDIASDRLDNTRATHVHQSARVTRENQFAHIVEIIAQGVIAIGVAGPISKQDRIREAPVRTN